MSTVYAKKTLPSRAGLNQLARGQRTLQDYAKASPDSLKEARPVASAVMSIIASQRPK